MALERSSVACEEVREGESAGSTGVRWAPGVGANGGAPSQDWRSRVRQHTRGFHSLIPCQSKATLIEWRTVQLVYSADKAAACIRPIRGQNGEGGCAQNHRGRSLTRRVPPGRCRGAYSTTPRNENRVNENHLDQSLSFSQKNGNSLTWVLVALTVCLPTGAEPRLDVRCRSWSLVSITLSL